MLALTLWPEWAWAIAHLDKRVENRDWPADRALWGQRIAIHAGKHIGGRPARHATEVGCDTVWEVAQSLGWELGVYDDHPGGVGVISGPPVGFPGREIWTPRSVEIATSAIVAIARLVGCYRGLRERWADPEAWGWKLEDVVTLAEPVTGVRGFQKLWTLSAADEAAVLERADR